jgi:hypothetical protein
MGDRRKKKPYSKEDLETAFKAVKNGISIREACRIYGVPRTTLGDRLAERHGTVNGRQPELTAEEEKRIVAMAQLLSIWGFPFTSVDLCHFVKNYLDRRGTVTRFKDNLPTHRSRGLYISLKTISPSPLINFPFFFLLSFKFPPLFAFPNSDFFTKYHQPIFYPLLPPPFPVIFYWYGTSVRYHTYRFVARFLGRHPELSLRATNNIKRARAGLSREEVDSFFEHYSEAVKDVPPENIWNYDETNFQAGSI